MAPVTPWGRLSETDYYLDSPGLWYVSKVRIKNPQAKLSPDGELEPLQIQYNASDLAQAKDEHFWYEDGSVILATPTCQFCVHKSILSRHSEVFKRLFSKVAPIPPRKVHDDSAGLPVVHLTDDAADFRRILRVLYIRG